MQIQIINMVLWTAALLAAAGMAWCSGATSEMVQPEYRNICRKLAEWTGGIEEGTRRFLRNIFTGAASARFHRKGPSENFFGIRLNGLAQTHITSARMLFHRMNIFDARPVIREPVTVKENKT
jgi:hypothetical protein